MKRVTELISRAMAKSLNLHENCFLKQFGERSQLQARFNYYSPCKRPDLVLGLKPHSDGSGYTIIMQDEVGLQVLKDDKWYKIPKNPHALLVLMADQMEVSHKIPGIQNLNGSLCSFTFKYEWFCVQGKLIRCDILPFSKLMVYVFMHCQVILSSDFPYVLCIDR